MSPAMDKDDISRLRAVPLETVLEGLGALRDPKDPAHNWRWGASRITVTEARFYDHNGAGALHRMAQGRAGGGGAIDLVQYLKDLEFRDAVRELKGLTATYDGRVSAPPKAGRGQGHSDRRPFPEPALDRAARVAWYLNTVRKIPEAIVQSEMRGGAVFADARGNVVFRLRNEAGQEIGYEVRGTYEKPYHSVHGEKGLFISKASDARTVSFVESGIEALSYRALRDAGLIVSTTGSAVEKPVKLARLLQERGYEIVAAFNADKGGDRMAEGLREILGEGVRRDRPVRGAKDWNEELQSRGAARGDTLALPSRREMPGEGHVAPEPISR